MATNLLTDAKVKNAKAQTKEYLLADGDNLFLRVRPDGSKSWLFVYVFAGKRRKLGLGAYSGVTLATAREEAARARACIAGKIDPQLARVEREAEQEAKRQALEAVKARLTVRGLFDRWERLELKGRKDKGAEVRRSFEKDIFPTLGDIAAEDVKRGMIADALDKVVERGSPVVARNLLGDLRQMFGYGIKRALVENDPTSHLKRNDFGQKNERDRVLSDEEIKLLKGKLPSSGLHAAGVAAVWIMLSTCCRVGEIIQARWEHIDLEAGTWRIPPENAKNGKEHLIRLSDFSKVHFEALKQLATDDDGGVSRWVMPAMNKCDTHVCIKSLSKQVGDRQRGEESKPMKNRTKLVSALVLPRGKWTPHDLRRTGATLMGRLGVRPDVIEKCLNHVEQNKLVRIYQRQELSAEQAEAWRLLGERLELLTSDADNVISFQRSA